MTRFTRDVYGDSLMGINTMVPRISACFDEEGVMVSRSSTCLGCVRLVDLWSTHVE